MCSFQLKYYSGIMMKPHIIHPAPALRITAGLITFYSLPVFQTSKRIPVIELPEIGGSRQSRVRKATVVEYLVLIIQQAS